jgi:hypothetical protein
MIYSVQVTLTLTPPLYDSLPTTTGNLLPLIISRELTIFGERLKESLRQEQSYAGVEAAERWQWPVSRKSRPHIP